MRKRTRPAPPTSGKVEKTRGWAALNKLLEKKSQTELSEESEVAQSAISSAWKLDRLPSRATIWRFEEAFGIKAGWWNEKVKPESRAA